MTAAPACLLNTRRLLLAELGPHGLASAEVGIVGDPAHRGGYHCGSDRLDPQRDYSATESPRDKAGLTLDAAALDVGTFAVQRGGATYDLRHFSRWLAGQCAAGAADCRDIREVIYSPDGKVVRRWDALGRRSSGDDSHLGHTHISYYRDAVKAGRDQRPVMRRYLASIGLLEDVDMTPEEHDWLRDVRNALLAAGSAAYPAPLVQQLRDVAWVLVQGPAGSGAWVGGALERIAAGVGIDPAELEQISAAAREGAASAADALVAAVLAKLPPGAALTRADVEVAVRDAFAGGLAPDVGRAAA